MSNSHFIYHYDVTSVNSLIKDIKSNNQYFIVPIWDFHCVNLFYNKKGHPNEARILAYRQRNDIEIQYLSIRFNDSLTIQETLYRLKNHIYEKPKCPTCGKELRFNGTKYFKHCSYKCSANDPHTRELCKETCREKWGVDNVFQSKEIIAQIQEESLKKYGTKAPGQSEECKERRKATNRKKYGCDYASQSQEIIEKIKRTSLERFGVDNPSKAECIKKKKAETCLKHFGCKCNFQDPDQKEKIKQTNLRKYGVENPYQAEHVKTKTRYLRIRHSKGENELYDILINVFGTDDVKREYKSDVYSYFCDMYIVSLDLYIEYQAYWTHGKHPFRNTFEDQQQLKFWLSRKDKSSIYESAVIAWTQKDPLKRQTAKNNNLNYLEIFPDFPLEEVPNFIKENFNIDNPKQIIVGEK